MESRKLSSRFSCDFAPPESKRAAKTTFSSRVFITYFDFLHAIFSFEHVSKHLSASFDDY